MGGGNPARETESFRPLISHSNQYSRPKYCNMSISGSYPASAYSIAFRFTSRTNLGRGQISAKSYRNAPGSIKILIIPIYMNIDIESYSYANFYPTPSLNAQRNEEYNLPPSCTDTLLTQTPTRTNFSFHTAREDAQSHYEYEHETAHEFSLAHAPNTIQKEWTLCALPRLGVSIEDLRDLI